MAVTEQATINHTTIIQADAWTLVYGDSVSNHQPFKPLSIMPAALLHACFPWAETPTVLYFTII